MHIAKRFPGSFTIMCRHKGGHYSFNLSRLGEVVRCPVCGRQEKAADLFNDFTYRGRQSRRMGLLGTKRIDSDGEAA